MKVMKRAVFLVEETEKMMGSQMEKKLVEYLEFQSAERTAVDLVVMLDQ